jgi:hypothetical protein
MNTEVRHFRVFTETPFRHRVDQSKLNFGEKITVGLRGVQDETTGSYCTEFVGTASGGEMLYRSNFESSRLHWQAADAASRPRNMANNRE